ncbi:MAG TPA: FKBP-type peptidyl-prolyl cis-trans isomerase [Urbifossiella sp.]|jgi:hypothetical protein|nr:FKBP-type peptidyl-prolyl cis-trans isomerase [Urbifossiella sp.]
MDPRPFRPAVDGLESRLVPSVAPTEVLAAYNRTVAAASELYEFGTTLEHGRTTQEISFLSTALPGAALQSRLDTATLQQYRTEFQADIAANPAAGPALQQFMMQLAGAQAQATINGVYADVYGIGFGGTPIVPPPPPVDTSGGTSFSSGSSGSSSSTLPFSLTDPNFVADAAGVKIWDVTPGTGTAITTGSQFTANYTGYLTNGTVFDSSLSSGRTPLSTTLDTSHLIQGFVDGLNGMKVGGERRIIIPAALAYGSAGTTGVPANSDLVFDITLLSSP